MDGNYVGLDIEHDGIESQLTLSKILDVRVLDIVGM